MKEGPKKTITEYLEDEGYVEGGAYKISFSRIVELIYKYPKWLNKKA